MQSRPGRPREHGEETRQQLIAAAEHLVAERGPDALSVRTVASSAGTTTRAVYTLFGSKEGLVAALAARAFEMLGERTAAVAVTDDPQRDVVAIGLDAFRPMVLDHPALYRIAFQRVVGLRPDPDLVAARQRAFVELRSRVERLEEAGLLGSKTVPQAMGEIEAMFEGLANTELRGDVLPIMANDPVSAWTEGLLTVVRGLAAS